MVIGLFLLTGPIECVPAVTPIVVNVFLLQKMISCSNQIQLLVVKLWIAVGLPGCAWATASNWKVQVREEQELQGS